MRLECPPRWSASFAIPRPPLTRSQVALHTDQKPYVDASSLGGAVASVPLGQQLYDGGGREAGLPAGPFLARCGGGVAGECELVVGGEVPVGGVVVEEA